ncbi:MAG: tyrosine--tRNA ligase [Planctomycetes bacterium]|nr:tyrosine--tRNA ligase [Planctomycetota bacterium]
MTDETRGEVPAAVRAEVDRQKAEIMRGAVDVISEGALEKKLVESIQSGRPLRAKLGVDPTSSALHLGFTVVLNKLRAFQDLGHTAVLILGDATAMVGDPTGKNKTRPRLSHAEITKNAETYLDQAAKVLDVEKAEVRRNSEWLHAFDFEGFVSLLARYTVARMLERDDFDKRYKGQAPIYLHEFLYPLMQGWDSVMVQADVELGGTDQLFNLLVGRDLQEQEGQAAQVCLTTGLLVGLDGKLKMSKSYDNHVGISEAADDMFTKVMRVDDSMMRDWFTLLTRVPIDEVDGVLAGGANPRDVKLRLAHTLAAMYHEESAADAARDRWLKEISRKELPDDLVDVKAPTSSVQIVDLVSAAFPEAFKSRGEIRRLVKGGGVSLGGQKLSDPQAEVTVDEPAVLKAGKKNVCRVIP